MKNYLLILMGVVIFVTFSKSGRYFYDELSIGLYMLTILASIPIFEKIHWSAGLVFVYTIINGIYFSFKFPSPFEKYGFAGENLFKLVSSQAMVVLFLSSVILVNMSEKIFSHLVKSLPWICLISSGLIVYNSIASWPGGFSLGGVMENSSMDPSLISPLFPTIFYLSPQELREKKWFKISGTILVFLSLILSKGSVGIGAMAIALFFLVGMGKGLLKVRSMVIISSIVGMFILAGVYFEGSLLEDSSRFWTYKAAWKWWTKFENPFTGSGLGTYWGFGPMSQVLYWKGKVFPFDGGKIPIFTWLHSDWMQIGFELGIIGLLLSLNCAFHLLRNCIKYNRHWLFASIASYMGSMVFNMPIHWFISLFCGAILFRLGFMNEDEVNSLGI